ncbi:MAG: type II toxin-antitoxin system prevent-host-death family antitoxin [Candidatus Competibacteraceae bacterium]|uniref:Antitoxin n=1 Tax=Candidatus Contendobacter odensis Run_B_J11 TaxID=1400861 RepID=A0A7U7GB23_9GAMM|nr:type II toxin-antitoxin system prevent-host-death family antitoxin [Candidatus Contendobacter odensis]MBK8536970.1 type II toxin-antitoxin system prevent-host-death family antitoxin [Candidatus Competibacteraceae bacterium]MBK8751027.1 type II toxin-antitoxin system prevent-host-death family antitoxin [Candidatus Competibacteraceae bacterium]CDH45051.1 hypothetical protein BN874_2010015 [Candidatus Contendobacter odensis Run_B_J11]
MQTAIAAGDFKAKCLKLLDDVAATGESLVITKHGKALAKRVPMTKHGKALAKRVPMPPDFGVAGHPA